MTAWLVLAALPQPNHRGSNHMPAKRHRLAQLRRAAGHTQESFAERLGVARNTVVRWEAGTANPQAWHQPNLAKALDITTNTVIDLLTEGQALLDRQPVEPQGGDGAALAPLSAPAEPRRCQCETRTLRYHPRGFGAVGRLRAALKAAVSVAAVDGAAS